MKVLFASSEVHPFAKTGGLADVAGALPVALSKRGLEVAVCLPMYPKVRRRADQRELVAERVSCPFAGEDRPFKLWKTTMPGAPAVTVFLVENPWMFEAEEAFYGTAPGSYGDAHLRFLYFSRAVLRIPRPADFYPQIFHINDWQTALVAPLLRTVHRHDPRLAEAATVLTIHNLAYQGVFPVKDLAHAGVPSWLLREGLVLERGLGNLLASGLRFADGISTVSETYAQEIMGTDEGHGLDPLLRWRSDLLTGIVNGLDTDVWNPATDPHLDHHFSIEDLSGKGRCREQLLAECGLLPTDGPVFGIVSRLAAQKGLNLVLPVMEQVLASRADVRLVVLGSGEPELEAAFRNMAERFPGRASARLAFDPQFASLVEAGSDFFLMPSRFEPCGLNQLISMRYGTIPIVRAVGGLKDTVQDTNEWTLADGTAKGFVFTEYRPEALRHAVERALDLFSRKSDLLRVQRNGMEADWSWDRSAQRYIDLYKEAAKRRRAPRHLDVLIKDLPPDPIEVELPALMPIPEGYARDVLVLVPFAPRTLFAHWELGGSSSDSRLLGMTTEERRSITYELLVENEFGQVLRHNVGGLAHEWFVAVEPGRSYHGRLILHTKDRGSWQVLDAPPVLMPPDTGPEL
ncbi:MAG TPA: glycogen synthase GlgA [Planctomycetota bacterium]|nr:glycogen synthase GlgA [Planctomycetota bacterium]